LEAKLSGNKKTLSWWVDPDWEPWVLAAGIVSVDSAWNPDLPGVLVNDRGDRQVLRLEPAGETRVAYLKRWRYPGPVPFRRLLPVDRDLRHRTAWEFENLEEISALGIRVPKPVLLGQSLAPGGPVAAILLLEDLTGYQECVSWIGQDAEKGEQAAGEIGRLLGIFHRNGLYYRSPGIKHFYIDAERPEGDPRRFAILDLARIDREPISALQRLLGVAGKEIPSEQRDLTKVLLSLADSLPPGSDWQARFWEGYSGAVPGKSRELKQRVEQMLARKKEDREARRRRKDR
jgi:hypothetical protein